MHSPKLEYLGLAAAMRSLCREVAERRHVPVDFAEANLPSNIPPEISICLFRVLQEALHNITKHRGVRFAEVKLQGLPNQIDLAIRDSGLGFDSAVMNGDSLGLSTRREQIHLAKGTISVRSKSQFGAEISVSVPLKTGATQPNGRENEFPRLRIVFVLNH